MWCAKCAKDKQAGTRKVFEASVWGEPAEYERVVKGIARAPRAEQRVVFINRAAYPMSQGQYDCDNCWTVWLDGMEEPAAWENEYLEV